MRGQELMLIPVSVDADIRFNPRIRLKIRVLLGL